MMETIAIRRDQDCEENRLLDFLTEYMNKTNVHKDKSIFYGEAKNMYCKHTVNNIKYYTINLNQYKKSGDCIQVRQNDVALDERTGEVVLRIHTIRELERKIHANKINKR